MAAKVRTFEMLMKHFTDICEPYEYEKESATVPGTFEIIKKFTDNINEERSLMKLVRQFLAQGKEGKEDYDEDEDQMDDEDIEESDEEANACDNLNQEL